MDSQDLNALRSVEELASYRSEVKGRMEELDNEFRGVPFTEEARGEFADLEETLKQIDARVDELEYRQRTLESAAGDERKREPEHRFTTPKAGVARGDDIYDLTTVRASFDNPAAAERELRDRAMRSIDSSHFPEKDAKENVARLVEEHGSNELALRILQTGSPTYKRAFAKLLANKTRTSEEERALSVASSGYAVPYVLDPTVTLTSNGAINPVRQIANVIQITGNHWTGVASGGLTVSYDAEGTEVSDDTPSLTQPTADVEKAQGYIEYTIELGDDWGSLQAEMARMLADEKDIRESAEFLTGLGHASNKPEGLLVGATGTVQTATGSVMAVGDIYSLMEALAPRWRSRAVFTGGLAAYQKIRQFDTNGGASLWVQLQFGEPANLVGRPAYEWSDYSSGVTTPGASVMTFGDFNQFTIIDRIGMNVEVVPHVFATANNRPSGKRGLYAYWRNTSDVRTSSAFKTLVIKS